MCIVKVNLLRHCTSRNYWQFICDNQIHSLIVMFLTNTLKLLNFWLEYSCQWDTLTNISIPSPSVNQGRVPSMNVEMLTQKHESCPNRVVPRVVSLQVWGQFLLICVAILLCDDIQILIKYHRLRPLHNYTYYYYNLLRLASSIQKTKHLHLTAIDPFPIIIIY